MKRHVRFTFIRDKGNRAAVASLVAALEHEPPGCPAAVRVADTERVMDLDFDVSPAGSEIVCFSSMSTEFEARATLLARLRTRHGESAFTSVCGGPHPSGDPAGTLAAGFDYCCAGEGEDVIRDVARALGEGDDPGDVPGVFGNRAGRPHGRRRAGWTDLDAYWPLPRAFRLPAHIEIGRGCNWGCAYCQVPTIHGPERFRCPDAVADTAGRYAEFGMKDFRLLLANALAYGSARPGRPDCDALEELLSKVRAVVGGGRIFLGSFPSEVRPDYVTPRALAIIARYVSNRRLVIGGQSGSPNLLDAVRRGHGVGAIRRACRTASAAGFEPIVDFMLGLPSEQEADRRATFDLIDDLGRQGAISHLHFFMPLPGTPLAGARPVPLTEAERRHIDRLAQEGRARGHWRRQERTAERWYTEHTEASPSR